MSVIPDSFSEKYELVIGLEVHVQLATESKIFSSDSAGFGAEPNQHVSAVSLGLPGTLPKLNGKVLEYAIIMGLATNCRINAETHFDRKNYFYADLPKGFQTTQDAQPVCQSGFVDVNADLGPRRIRLNRIHMEDDAGKSMHDQEDLNSLIDLNRAGVPLIEIVSEPDLRSAAEASAYLQEIRQLVRYLEISDGNMEEGSIRCDANISVRLRGSNEFGKRCEVKNLNSVRNLQRAIDHEFIRQCNLLEQGNVVEQNTLNFDALSGTTSPLRSKEMANDYRYFPEPDLPPVKLTKEFIEKLSIGLPELPAAKSVRFQKEMNLSPYDANLLVAEKETSLYFESVCSHTSNYKSAANWVMGNVKSWQNDMAASASVFPLEASRLAELIALIDSGKINNTLAAQQLFPAMIQNPSLSSLNLAESMGLIIDTDDNVLINLIEDVLKIYPEKVVEYHRGKKGVVGMFMGDVMRKSGGKINPQTANKLMIEILEKKK